MQSSLVNTPYMSRSSRVTPQRDGNLIHVTGGNGLARFNRMTDSDTMMHQDYAAKLLLQMHRIATNEILQSTPQTINTAGDTSVHLISPIHRPKVRSFKILPMGSRLALPSCAVLSDSPTRVSTLISQVDHSSSSLLPFLNASSRCRTVSIGGVNDDDVAWMKDLEMNNIVSTKFLASGSVSPLHLGISHATSLVDTQNHSSSGLKQVFDVTPDKANKLVFDNYTSTKSLHDRYHALIQSSSKDSFDQEEHDDDEESMMDYFIHDKQPSRKLKKCDRQSDSGLAAMCPSNKKKNIIANPFTYKYVGESVAPNVKVRDVLRKKFSWKSFPELEIYLINHRKHYLECSNAMNYTKAQKNYNNELTQGLLQVAANEGYVFEEFTFAAVRDRIRCFYKSFVQATKKKKRVHHHHFKQLQY